MNEEAGGLVTELRLDEEVGFVLIASGDVGKDFFVKEGDGVRVEVVQDVGNEEVEEVEEEG